MLYIAIHKHEYGQDIKIFKSFADAPKIFYNLPADDFDVDDNGDDPAITLTQVDFAKRLGLDYEPHKGEELDIKPIEQHVYDNIDFSDFT